MNTDAPTIITILLAGMSALCGVIAHLYRRQLYNVDKLTQELDECQELTKQLYDRMLDEDA